VSLKRFVAATSREALAAVRREFGEDAVVLANRRAPQGVEITAMASDAIDAVVELAAPATTPSDPEPLAAFLRRKGGDAPATSTAEFIRERAGRKAARAPASPPATPAAAAAATKAAPGPSEARLLDEIQAMRAQFADQLAAFSWSETARRHPLQARLTGELLAGGFSPALARGVLGRLPADFGDDAARRWMAAALARNLAVHAPGDFLDAGGVFALVGPTGVGKTTTAAKLAARYAMRYGARQVGLVTTDSYRIGAHEQLQIYGRILGIPVQLARGGSLAALVESMRDKKVVIVDTVGVGQRDARVPRLVAELDAAGARRVLLLSAAAQGETNDEVIRVYRPLGIEGAIVTKIDEAAKIGGTLDAAIRHRLALAFITNGQRVPEDLHPAQAAFLVHRALRAATAAPFALRDEEHGLLFSHAPGRPAGAPSHAG
jgi:flagellar biosynthesis protein FlhF